MRLLATVIAPLTAQLGEVTQPSAIRFRWHVAVPDFLLRALTRARRDASDGPQTAIQTSHVTLAITRRYARLATVFPRCTVVPCVKMLRAVTLGIHMRVRDHGIISKRERMKTNLSVVLEPRFSRRFVFVAKRSLF